MLHRTSERFNLESAYTDGNIVLGLRRRSRTVAKCLQVIERNEVLEFIALFMQEETGYATEGKTV
jgi:hypothetical protein